VEPGSCTDEVNVEINNKKKKKKLNNKRNQMCVKQLAEWIVSKMLLFST